MYKTTQFSNALQLDFWPAAMGGFALDVSQALGHHLLWGMTNFGVAAAANLYCHPHFARETESIELQLFPTLPLIPEVESVGIATPLAPLVFDYF